MGPYGARSKIIPTGATVTSLPTHSFPPNYSSDDAACFPKTFLDPFETDYGDRQLELRHSIVESLKGPLRSNTSRSAAPYSIPHDLPT